MSLRKYAFSALVLLFGLSAFAMNTKVCQNDDQTKFVVLNFDEGILALAHFNNNGDRVPWNGSTKVITPQEGLNLNFGDYRFRLPKDSANGELRTGSMQPEPMVCCEGYLNACPGPQ